jgi:hypothetical protein
MENNKKLEKDLNDYTKEDFAALPILGWQEIAKDFNSLIIIPNDEVHDSGFKCMEFVACRYNTPICRISGCSDVIHIDGIGDYGVGGIRSWSKRPISTPTDWSIDCLKTSGYLRLFTSGSSLQSGTALSSFEIFSVNETNNSNLQ